jgi:hypothetical protein
LAGRRCCAAQIFSQGQQQLGPAIDFRATKKPRLNDERGRQIICCFSFFPRLMVPELELAPGIENKFNRLPWCHRASPSTTRHESVKSTDADKLMLYWETVNRKLAPGRGRSRDDGGFPIMNILPSAVSFQYYRKTLILLNH